MTWLLIPKASLRSRLGRRTLASELNGQGPLVVSVNPVGHPASLLGSKMVKNAFGMDGNDVAK